MSNSNNKKMVFDCILGAILATSLLALNPSTITNAQAMPYGSEDYDDRYSYGDQYGDGSDYYQDDNRFNYDNNHQKKSSIYIIDDIMLYYCLLIFIFHNLLFIYLISS